MTCTTCKGECFRTGQDRFSPALRLFACPTCNGTGKQPVEPAPLSFSVPVPRRWLEVV